MHGWIDPFYEASAAAVEPGQIWAAAPLELPARHALKIDRVNPKDDSKVDFTLVPAGAGAFDHPPVHSLHLGLDEALAVTRAARDRPVIILGGTAAARLGEADASVIVIPLAPAVAHDEPTRRQIEGYAFANAFYLPASKRPAFAEGVARLDQAQPLPQTQLTEHRGLRLSSDALDALVEWYIAFSTDRLPEDSLILEYRREMLAQR